MPVSYHSMVYYYLLLWGFLLLGQMHLEEPTKQLLGWTSIHFKMDMVF
jgi:hypothetical protein